MLNVERIRELSFRGILVVAAAFMAASAIGYSIWSGDAVAGLLLAALSGGSCLLVVSGVMAVAAAAYRAVARLAAPLHSRGSRVRTHASSTFR